MHTYLSLLFFIPLAVVCFSGAILVYKNEINSLLAPNVVNVNLNKAKGSALMSKERSSQASLTATRWLASISIQILKNATKFG